MSELPAISLFSSVGGLDLGAYRAGFDIHAAVEFDRDSAASLRANHFSDRPEAVLERSIVGLDTGDITGSSTNGPAMTLTRRARWSVLNAADYRVPQLRKRLILYGTFGTEPPPLPAATHSGWMETRRAVTLT